MNSTQPYYSEERPIYTAVNTEQDKRGPYYHFFQYGWKGIGIGLTIASDEAQNELDRRETYIAIVFLFWGLTIGVRT